MSGFCGVWLSLVERLLREQEVASSNLVTPTVYCKPQISMYNSEA